MPHLQGTLAKEILGGPSSITTREGRRVSRRCLCRFLMLVTRPPCAASHRQLRAHASFPSSPFFLSTALFLPLHPCTRSLPPVPQVPLRLSVHNISFSAHADYDQTSGFLDALRPPHVVLVHGEYGEMRKLAKALKDGAKAAGVPREVYTPVLQQTVAVGGSGRGGERERRREEGRAGQLAA